MRRRSPGRRRSCWSGGLIKTSLSHNALTGRS
jgi:hypothetical protein